MKTLRRIILFAATVSIVSAGILAQGFSALNLQTTSHGVALSWTASTSAGITGYNILRGATSGSEAQYATSTTTTYSDSSVTAGDPYCYEVEAVSSTGTSVPSNEACVTIPSTTTAVTSVAVTPTSASLTVGGTDQLSFMITPSGASPTTVTWSSSNTAVATVSSSGLVTAVAAGAANVTATSTQTSPVIASNAVAITVTATSTSYLLEAVTTSYGTLSGLTFTGAAGIVLPTQSFYVETNLSLSVPVSVSSNASWLTVSPATGNTQITVVATVNTTSLSVGQHNATIKITATGPNSKGQSITNSPITVPVTLTVSAGAPTSVSLTITCPVPASGKTTKETITVSAAGVITTSGGCTVNNNQ